MANVVKSRKNFSDLPQPGKVDRAEVTKGYEDNYLSGLESYIDTLSNHIRRIQQREIERTNEFTKYLQDSFPTGKSAFFNLKEDEESKKLQFVKDLKAIRANRKFYRSRLYEAMEERKNYFEAAQIQRDSHEYLRAKLSQLSLLEANSEQKAQREKAKFDIFSIVFIVLQVAIAILYSLTTVFPDMANVSASKLVGGAEVSTYYSFYIHIGLMVFVGFGLLMSYMKKFGYGGLGMVFMLAAFALQWSVLVMGFFTQASVVDSSPSAIKFQSIELGIDNLIWGLYGCTSVLVGLGAVLGRLPPFGQLFFVLVFIPFFGLNHWINNHYIHFIDLGGSIHIFTYGAMFGVAFSWAYSIKTGNRNSENNQSSYISDVVAFIGTVFLFVFWPSFNAAFAPKHTQYRVIINTVLALSSSVIFAFIFSRAFRGGRFKMSDVQRSSLAGGIAMGSVASFLIGPGAALTTGAVAGATSCLCFIHLQPILSRNLPGGFQDTMGVLNVFGIPGVIGAFTGAIAAGVATDAPTIYGQQLSELFTIQGNSQGGYELIALCITIGLSIVPGAVLGLLGRLVGAVVNKNTPLYSDENDWVVSDDFEFEVVEKNPLQKY